MEDSQYQNPSQTGKKKRKKWPIIVAAVVVFLMICGAIGSQGNKSAPTSSDSSSSVRSSSQSSKAAAATSAKPSSAEAPASSAPASSAPASVAPTTKVYSSTLLPGFYEVGTDIPAGTYDFKIASGSGNVTSDDGSINLIMGNGDDSMYQKSYKNAELTDGMTLSISQCSIKVSSKEASTEVKKRDNSSAKEFSAASGKYKAGKDFKAGYYDIKLTGGSGNVICTDNGLNAIMSTDSTMGVTEYKNVKFSDGNTLDLEGANVKLIPSK